MIESYGMGEALRACRHWPAKTDIDQNRKEGGSRRDEETNLNKEQFLHDLTVQLNLSVSDQVIREQIAYYDSYICGEVRKGRSEAEVIEELGSPRLLAKTIIDTAEAAGDPIASQDDEIRGTVDLEPDSDAFDHFRANYSGAGARNCETEAEDAETVRQGYEDENHQERESYAESGERNDSGWSDPFYRHHSERKAQQSSTGSHVHVFDASGWGCVAVFIIFFLLFQVLVGLIGGVLAFLSPVLLPLLVVLVVLWLIKGIINH